MGANGYEPTLTIFLKMYLFSSLTKIFQLFQEQLQTCIEALNLVLPEHLKSLSQNPDFIMPDSTSKSPDLICTEELLENSCHTSSEDSSDSSLTTLGDYCLTSPGSRSSSPLSAVDIFTEFNTNILQPMFDQVDQDQVDSSFSSILVS